MVKPFGVDTAGIRSDAKRIINASLDVPAQGFVLPPERTKAVAEKLQRFITAGPSQIKTVWDFDRTITQGTLHNGHDATVLGYLTSCLPDRVQRRLFQLSDHYRPLEIENRLSLAQAEDWWITPYNAYSKRKHNLSRTNLEGFHEVAKPRYGVVSVFKRLEDLDIPRIISSGGNKDVISLWNNEHNISTSDIVSTEFEFNGKGEIRGWKKKTLIHVYCTHKFGQSC